jgi:hypothetical protein
MQVEALEFHTAIRFPTYEEPFFSSEGKNANSEFVQRRKQDLKSFFYALFNYYPHLFYHPSVVQFFQLSELFNYTEKAKSKFNEQSSGNYQPISQIFSNSANATSHNNQPNSNNNNINNSGGSSSKRSGMIQHSQYPYASYSRLKYVAKRNSLPQHQQQQSPEQSQSHLLGVQGDMTFVEFIEFDAWFQACQHMDYQSQQQQQTHTTTTTTTTSIQNLHNNKQSIPSKVP